MTQKFSIFGMGKDGIPSYFRRWFAGGGDVAVDDHIVRTADQSDDAKTVSLVLDQWRGDPAHRLAARAMMAGLISPDTRLPLPSQGVREELGFPPRLKKFREFAEAAGREAFALALTVRRDEAKDKKAKEKKPKLVDALCILIDRADDGKWVLSDNALHEASSQSWELVDVDALQDVARSIVRSSTRQGVSRATIKEWRAYPEFRHIVKEVGGHLSLRLNDSANLSDKAVREAALKAPVNDVLTLVGEVPSVWGATPARKAAGRASFAQLMHN